MSIKTKIAIKIILFAYKYVEINYRSPIFISNLIKTGGNNGTNN